MNRMARDTRARFKSCLISGILLNWFLAKLFHPRGLQGGYLVAEGHGRPASLDARGRQFNREGTDTSFSVANRRKSGMDLGWNVGLAAALLVFTSLAP